MADGINQKYMLMHKNISVAEIEIDEASGYISAIGEIFEKDHIPVGVPIKKGEIDRSLLNDWWKGRAIPASRYGIKEALQELNLSTTQKLLDKCLGLSLSDQYWICPKESSVTWSQVNFFENTFSEDVGNLLFGKGSSGEQISLMSPDNTSDGWLKKKWKIIDGKRFLIKGGSAPAFQEPYNEVIATAIMKRLGIPHIPYTLTEMEEYPYSVCEDFITTNTELISAWYIMQTQKKLNHVSVYQHYRNCCEELGIPNVEQSLNQMLVLDYMIANEDRHQNNFGVVRNAETLEWIGAAPIFDNGTSLWFNQFTNMIRPTANLSSKPFKTTHSEQIKLVTDFDWLDLSKLHGIEEEIKEILKGSPFIDTARGDALIYAVQKRVSMLEEVQTANRTIFAVDDRSEDVREDIAYSGENDYER